MSDEREPATPMDTPITAPPDAPMSHAEVVETDTVDRYLLGQMPEAEARRFEEHFFSCSECLEQLKVTETLVDGMRHVATRDIAVVSLSLWARWRRRAWVGIAALVLVLPALFFYRQWTHSQDRLEQALSEPRAGVAYLPLSPTRHLETPPSHIVRLDPQSEWVLLSLELAPPISPTYDIELIRAGHVLWRSQPTMPNAFDALVVQVPTSILEPGDYAVEVTSDAKKQSRFTFSARALE